MQKLIEKIEAHEKRFREQEGKELLFPAYKVISDLKQELERVNGEIDKHLCHDCVKPLYQCTNGSRCPLGEYVFELRQGDYKCK